LQHVVCKVLSGAGRCEAVGESDPQVGLFEHVEQRRRGPPLDQQAVQLCDVHRRGLSFQRSEPDPSALAVRDLDIVSAVVEVRGEVIKARLKPCLDVCDESVGVRCPAETLVVVRPVRVEVDGEIIVRVAPLVCAVYPVVVLSTTAR
jgi:hypothetical protein